jgi:hypothetical protein
MDGDNSMMGSVESGSIKVVDFAPRGADKNDQISQDNEYIDTSADTYRYDNAETPSVEPEEEEAETNDIPNFEKTDDGVGFEDEKIKNVVDDESEENDYEEEDIEDENDEIKDF